MKPNRSRLYTVLRASALLSLTGGSAAAQDASSIVISADAGRGAPNPTYQAPAGSVVQLAIAFPVASSIRHWPLEVSFGRSNWHTQHFRCSLGICRESWDSASVTYLGFGVRRAAERRGRRLQPVGRLGVGRYSFGKATAGAVRWGGYAGFSIDWYVSTRAAIGVGLAMHVSRGPDDGPLERYLNDTGMALVGFRMTF